MKTLTTESLPPKVEALKEAETRIKSFKKAHAKLFREFDELLQDYNQKLEDAETEARAMGESVGPFSVIGYQTKIDAERLLEELGPDDFEKVGGRTEVQRVLLVDRVKFEAYAESGLIPTEVLESCYQKKPKFKTPKRAELP